MKPSRLAIHHHILAQTQQRVVVMRCMLTKRILGIDPGALRLGWACVEVTDDGYNLLGSGIMGVERAEGVKFNVYRMDLIQYWVREMNKFWAMGADEWYAERLPAVGGGNFIAATQSELAKTVLTVIEALAYLQGLRVIELESSHVKSRLTGNGNATKVRVRNEVIQVFPELWPRKKELTDVADESDAIGIALVGAGYHHKPTLKRVK